MSLPPSLSQLALSPKQVQSIAWATARVNLWQGRLDLDQGCSALCPRETERGRLGKDAARRV